MGVVFEAITEKHAAFMRSVRVFFVATAPTSAQHRVNVSPRAPGTSVVIAGPTTVYWGDLSGSGCETAAHVLENGRMTLMFINIEEGPPNIVRLHGTAKILLPSECEAAILDQLPPTITKNRGFRCVYKLECNRITTSCGFTIPVMQYVRDRRELDDFIENKDMTKYRQMYNGFSIDGLPSLTHLDDSYQTTGLGPNVEKGYVVARPLAPGDVAGKLQAKARIHTTRASSARDLKDGGFFSSSSLARLSSFVVSTHSAAFVLGALACCALTKPRGA
mmetsp:Transcript_18916/g.58284  ORF Transcript_18916/g.58284 Transcript_18916/m.58284 type:complete len:276 (-) Transcript_18916:476-1303(-)